MGSYLPADVVRAVRGSRHVMTPIGGIHAFSLGAPPPLIARRLLCAFCNHNLGAELALCLGSGIDTLSVVAAAHPGTGRPQEPTHVAELAAARHLRPPVPVPAFQVFPACGIERPNARDQRHKIRPRAPTSDDKWSRPATMPISAAIRASRPGLARERCRSSGAPLTPSADRCQVRHARQPAEQSSRQEQNQSLGVVHNVHGRLHNVARRRDGNERRSETCSDLRMHLARVTCYVATQRHSSEILRLIKKSAVCLRRHESCSTFKLSHAHCAPRNLVCETNNACFPDDLIEQSVASR